MPSEMITRVPQSRRFLQRSDIFRGQDACMLLEETGEVLGVFEAEGVGGLGGGEPTDQQALGATDKEALDDLCGTLARNTSHHIAEIAGRQT